MIADKKRKRKRMRKGTGKREMNELIPAAGICKRTRQTVLFSYLRLSAFICG
jgi:hypothetical protein